MCGFDAVKPFEEPGHLVGRHTDSSVGDGDTRVVALPAHADRNGPGEGELQCIRQQVEDHLLPHVAIDVDGFVERRTLDDEFQPGPFDSGPEDAGQFGGDSSEVDGLDSEPARGPPLCERSPAAC